MTDTEQKKAAIAIDNWKLPIFERHLAAEGYTWEKGVGLTEDTMFLFVSTTNFSALAQVVLAANTEAARTKRTRTDD